MDERKHREDDEQRQDELKMPDERVEDLEPDEEDSADVKGGISLNYSKIDPS
jgi:hypothetical protein